MIRRIRSPRLTQLATVIVLLMFGQATAQTITTAIQQEIFDARDKVLPALVHIQPITHEFRTGKLEKQASVGSGVIFHKDGYVVTNYHVAGKATRILCTLNDREVVPAEFIGGDPLTDIAVIKLDLSNYDGTITVAEFGYSDSIEVGQFVLAMGSPLTLSRSVSFGVVSTRDRYFSPDQLPTGELTGRYNLWIQTDAAINPGNSGGPLVDLSGRVIGINARASRFANNLGFAIPIKVVEKATRSILAIGEVIRSYIGVHCQPLQELEGYFGTNVNSGVLIASIDPGSPAEKSFLKAGDVILKIDDKPVSARFYEELPSFYSNIADREPGSTIGLTVLRGDQTYNFSVVTKQLGDVMGDDFECKEWDFTVKAITRQMQIDRQLTDTLGVYVVGVKRVGIARDGRLRRGDVIAKVNQTSPGDLSEFIKLYNNLVADKTPKILLTIKRNGSIRFVMLNMEDKTGTESNE